jgi:hypothetical protein
MAGLNLFTAFFVPFHRCHDVHRYSRVSIMSFSLLLTLKSVIKDLVLCPPLNLAAKLLYAGSGPRFTTFHRAEAYISDGTLNKAYKLSSIAYGIYYMS